MRRRFARILATSLLALSLPASGNALTQQADGPATQQKENSRAKTGKEDQTSTKNRSGENASQTPRPPAPGSQDPAGKIVLETKLVSVPIAISDKLGRLVTGFEKKDFEIYDDGVKQEIAHFSDEDAPITLGIVYDVSGSMSDLTNQSFSTLRRFFDTSHPDDEFFVVAFNTKPQLVQDFTVSPNDILNRVIFVKAKGNTALYDATYLAIEKARQGRHSKKALLILSDGLENSSRYSGKEIETLLKESDVQIYAIGISAISGGSGTLRQIAGMTGGRAFFPLDDNEVGDVYTRMALHLRHQYVIGFYPTDTTSGTRWHEVRVKLKAPKSLGRLSLYYKKGYQTFN